MKNSLFLKFLLFYSALAAQPSVQWQKCLGGAKFDLATSSCLTNDSGCVIAGYALSNDGDIVKNSGVFDFWLVKLNQFGIVQWTKNYGGSNIDWPYDIQQTSEGGFIVVGQTYSNDGDISGSHGGTDAWVVKLNAVGELEWKKCFGGSKNETANSVAQTLDGGYIIAGETSSTDGDVSGMQGYSDMWVFKLDENGVMIWQKCLGGSSNERARSIIASTSGGFVIVGETRSDDGDVLENNGNVDVWVVKINDDGVLEWENSLGGNALDAGGDIVETSDGYVVCGYVGSLNSGDVTVNHGFFDSWIVKLDKTGQVIWQKAYGGTDADYGRTLIQTKDGNLLVAGEAKSQDGDVEGNDGIQIVWILKLDQNGELIWKKPLGGTQGEGCWSIQQTKDDGYIMAGYAWSNDGDVSGNHGEADYWVVKLAPESSATSEQQTYPLEIVPNPAAQTIAVNLPSEERVISLRVVDQLGRLCIEQKGAGSLDVSALPNGFYGVTVIGGSGKVYVGKFWVAH